MILIGKTIKQIADELGVSKQAITYRLNKLQATNKDDILVVKENGIWVVSLAGESLIKSAFTESSHQNFTAKQPPKEPPNKNQENIEFLLKNKVKILEKEIKLKEEQITELHRCLDSTLEQGTHITEMFLESKKTIEKLENELLTEREHSREQADKLVQLADQSQQLQLAQLQQSKSLPIMSKKYSLWKRIFNKK